MIHFVKYQGAGNDFILIDNRTQAFKGDKVQFAITWCDRRFGIGSDGVIFIENCESGDFLMDFYNPDGSQSFCGNGSRCAVAFANKLNIISDSAHFVAVDGEHDARIEGKLFHIKMGDVEAVQKHGNDLEIYTGSPHYLINCDQVNSVDVVSKGREIRNSDNYKEKGINVNFIEYLSDDSIHIRTYERGVENETLACGTGATAAALSFAYRKDLEDGTVKVKVQGGELRVSFEKNGNGFQNIWLVGPAEEVYSGVINE